jgi:hypothetical protein
MRQLIDNAGHWLERANETRTLAAQMKDAATLVLIEVAKSYERLAELANDPDTSCNHSD